MNNKSAATLRAAQRLIDLRFFTQSVHCSYYAVLQMMRFRLAHAADNPLSYAQQDAIMSRQSSHEALLIEIKKRIANPRIKRHFGQEFENLKKRRVEADYSQQVFTDVESLDCKQQADGLISKLNNI